MSIYDTLNDRQQEAVFYTEGPLLILAGAGSGKTRVLTHRIAWLIDQIGVNPWNILAITFTNKAAGEMRERVDQIVGFGSESIWVSTFHSMCVRILRRYIDRLGYDTNFTIYDTDDQKTLIKEVCRKVDVDTKVFKERSLLSAISSAKNEMILPDEFELNAGGVDWDRLAELVNGSDMTYKEEVLAILRSHPEEERNDRLKALAGGRPYRSVLDVLYPQLRDACYIRVQYANRPDSVADTVNRAIEAIRGRKYEEAFRLLKTVEADERSWNVRGVCHLLCGDDKEAGVWLHRAVKAGNREAEENLKKMNAERRAATIGITQ